MNRQILLGDLASWRVATFLFVTALMAGCAASPEDIAPEYVHESRFEYLTCEQLLAESSRVESALTAASTRQRETRSNDVAGIIFLALPLGSMTSEDLEPEIARLKGERDALDRGAKLKSCDDASAKKEAGKSATR